MRAVERELGRLAAQFGFDAPTTTRNNHLAFRHKITGRTVFFSNTTGDRRAWQRLKAKFRAVEREVEPFDIDRRPLPGCCPDCEGTGSCMDESTGGRCWTCLGSGHAHEGPCPAGDQ